jgi:formylglycine-generating enzyme required for sulfatase activity
MRLIHLSPLLLLAALGCSSDQEATTFTRAANESFVDCPQCPEMVPIPPGEFFMGTTEEELQVADLPAYFEGRELPRHRVKISKPFAVSKYEVSIARYAEFIDDTEYAPADGCWRYIGSEFIFDESWSWRNNGLKQDDDHPVTCISWHDAVAYSDWLSERSGQRYRLLSEAEWEYTARAGTETPYWFGASADEICKYVNLGDITTRDRFRWHEKKMKYAPLDNWSNVPCRDGYAATAPVTFGSPNPFGVYNMLGNVQELVADCWQKGYMTGPYTEAPRQLSGDCGYRVMRGQGWSAIAASTRSAFRAKMLATDRRFYLGIRVARDLPVDETP